MSNSFVRTEMLAAQEPPLGQKGAVKWLRENLFSGPVNTILTLLGLFVIFWLVARAAPWWWNGVWDATSLGECRQIVAANGAESGACWAVIRARWHQYIFGFYPSELYWRPVLAAGLLMVALAPVLFWNDRKAAIMAGISGALTLIAMLFLGTATAPLLVSAVLLVGLFALAWSRPKLLIWVTLSYPFASLFLLWGGSVWLYLSAMLAAAVGVGFGLLYSRLKDSTGNLVYALLTALGAAVVAAALLHYLNAVSADFLTKISAANSFYPGWGAESGILVKLLGAIVSAVVWVISMLVWAMVAVMRAISATLDLNLGMIFGGTLASFLGLGAILAGLGTFRAARSRAAGLGILGGLLALGAYFVILHPLVTAQLDQSLPLGLTKVSSDQFGGFLLAIVIGVSAIAASLPLGIILALGRRSDMFLVKTLSVGFIEFIRGVPLITLLFTASLLLAYFLPPGTNFDLILRVIILASLFASAYIAEVVRGGLAALPRGQYEAADALGLDYWQAQRLIIMPQALKISIPGIVSTFIGLFKDTTLVSFVGLLDPLRGVTQIVRADINWKGIYWEPYIFVGAIFFIICFGMSRYSMYLERKLKTDHR
ncbi:amino acid ABC transporter permease [Xinfangfangia sp. CPCC 101601]|uniref:Amino acid ABC transporter permease n=1 Tax=Pseudogemmobacter lacusdianii TaxID=3069608 RepID=A0ABU0W0D5_9RHOB|nr:amino acid ABC transporter permease [Xinfangfangia sp. CPCC 101601]MDQ2067481.1 amino acid ABC transporter permease [Xinfangfangia sp. CPCC 101601]